MLQSSKKKIFIEEAGRDDLQAVADIHAKSFTYAWSDGDFEQFISQDAYFCLIARPLYQILKKPVAFILIKQLGEEAEIISFATMKNVRRRGIAEQVLNYTIRRLAFDGAKTLFLEVEEGNKQAIALYRKLGFEQTGRREGYYRGSVEASGGASAALVMKLDLS